MQRSASARNGPTASGLWDEVGGANATSDHGDPLIAAAKYNNISRHDHAIITISFTSTSSEAHE